MASNGCVCTSRVHGTRLPSSTFEIITRRSNMRDDRKRWKYRVPMFQTNATRDANEMIARSSKQPRVLKDRRKSLRSTFRHSARIAAYVTCKIARAISFQLNLLRIKLLCSRFATCNFISPYACVIVRR